MATERALVTEKLRVFLPQTVNVDGLKAILPMLVAALAQYVNVPLLLDAFGMEPDVIETSVSSLKDYFKSGLD